MGVLGRLWAERHDRPVFVAVSGLTLAAFLAMPLLDWYLRSVGIGSPVKFYDFGAYANAVDRWVAGEALYVEDASGGYHGSYLYPPVVLLLFRPFAALPFRQGAILWQTVSVGLLWGGLGALVNRLGHDLTAVDRIGLLWVLLGFHPLLIGIKLGQTAAFLGGVCCLAAVALLDGRAAGGDQATRSRLTGRLAGRPARFLSGAATALTAVVKLPYATAGAHLLADRDRFSGAVIAGLTLVSVSLAVFGVDAHRTYLDVLRWGVRGGAGPRSPALWLPPYYRPFYVVGSISLPLRIGGAAAIAALALASSERDPETFALGAAAIPLLAPRTYTYYFVAAMPAIAILIAVEYRRDDGRPTIPAVAALLLTGHAYGLKLLGVALAGPLSGDVLAATLGLLQPGLWGNLLLVGLAGYRVAEGVSWPDVVGGATQ